LKPAPGESILSRANIYAYEPTNLLEDGMERTLIILKPDAVQRRLMGRIITRFEEKGFKVIAAKFRHIDRAMAEKHYAVHEGKPFYESLVEFITRGPVLAFVLEAENAIKVSP